MIPDSIWAAVEDSTFSASLGVVSTPRAFDAAFLRQRPVRDLLSLLTTPANLQAVATRIHELLHDPGNDARYCHPFDLPIAVYLRALDICEPGVAARAADAILRFTNLWWARAMALRVARQLERRTPVQRKQYRLVASHPEIVREERASSPPYLFPMEVGWQPAVQARSRVNTDSQNQPVDFYPVPAPVRVHTVGAVR